MIGTILSNRYELLEKIGEGGMSVVYKAKCHKLNRFDAVKILKQEFANDKDLVEKFKREATAVANLSDNNIINIFDVGSQGDINYIVMEYVKGKTLKQIIVENIRLSYERSIDIAIQIGKALDCAHRNQIIHRDVKPHNILVGDDGVVKVTDFGIAKAPTSGTITNCNKVMGSAHYFSPEQAKGSFTDARTDIYSLGIVIYEMVTGKVPYDAESPVSVAIKHIQEPAVPPRHIVPGIPESLNRLILKAIEKDPIRRYQSIKEILFDLLRIQKDLNYHIKPSNIDDDFTKVMSPVNIQDTNFDDDDNHTESGVSSRTKKIIIFSLAAIIVIALGAVMGWVASNKPSPGRIKPPPLEALKVPDIMHKDFETARELVKELGLKLVVSDTEKSEWPEGTILWAFPPVGTVVKPNSEISVRISEGLPMIKVPNLSEYNVKSAQDVIKSYDLLVGKIDYENSDTVDVDLVIRQNPEPDSQVPKGTKVDLIVSKGPKTVKVPDLTGRTIAEAENMLKNVNLVLGKRTAVDTNDQSLDGKIFDQNREKDSNVKEQTEINVSYYVYKEPAKVTVPKFVGKTVAQAKAMKEVVENKIELILPANTKDTDIITKQSVDEETLVTVPVRITITVQPAPEPSPTPTPAPTTGGGQ
jgi:eukaryotic-like serine/threonine-protein kinase